MVGIDLHNLRVFRPVIEPVLGQGAEGPEARAQREHDIGLGDQLHGRLGSLITQRPAGEVMARGEGIVVQVTADHRRAEILGERLALLDATRENHAAARKNDGEFRLGEQLGGGIQRLRSARARAQ